MNFPRERAQDLRAAVVVPVYNDGVTMARCLKALSHLREKEGWEFVVIDDCSGDDSSRIAARSGFRVIRMDKNLGVSAARNAGARATTAEILVFVDADVVADPGCIEAMFEVLQNRPEIHAVGAYPRPGDLSSGWSSHFVGLRSAWGYHWKEGERERHFSSVQSECGAIRRKAFEDLGGFSERHGGVGMEEFHMAHEMEKRGLGHLLIRAASYMHHYKPLGARCRALFDRTARWVPLLFRRKKFESRGAVGTARASLSCLMTFAAVVVAILSLLHSELLIPTVLILIAQCVLEFPFLRFARKMYGWRMVLYSLLALQVLNLATGAGFIRGLVRLIFSGGRKKR